MGSTILSEFATNIFIPVCAVVGSLFSVIQWVIVSKVKLIPNWITSTPNNNLHQNGYAESLIEEDIGINEHDAVVKCAEIRNAISEGAASFLYTEYEYVGIFMEVFAVIIYLFLGSVDGFSTETRQCRYNTHQMCKPAIATAFFTTISFLLGSITSIVSSSLGMKIATYAIARTTLESRNDVRKAFVTAFRTSSVMGFFHAGNGLLVLYITINLLKLYYGDDWEGLFQAVTGYGLGGSSMALFGVVGGGIFTKAAVVGADLIGKIEREDDTRNLAVIAGMGSDIFSSYAESSCAVLVIASMSSFGINHDFTSMCYPLLVSSVGIVVCLITTLFATDFLEIKSVNEIEQILKKQLIISTILMTFAIAIVSWIALPSSFTVFSFGQQKVVSNWQLFLCVCVGLWAGLIICFVTGYYTSNAYSVMEDVADTCRTRVATNVIYGLVSGYKLAIIPIFGIVIIIFISFKFAAMYGIAVASLGMLSTIATRLTIDAYGPITHNAGEITERTDAFNAVGNTTTAIGKGFAIGSAVLVSLALFCAFVSRARIQSVDMLTPKVLISLVIGVMLPYWFSAMAIKSVANATLKTVKEFNNIFGLVKQEYATCIKISTDTSFKEMISPGAFVMLTPLIIGTVFGVEALSSVLVGSLISRVRMAIFASNTSGIWDNTKKYIEVGASEQAKSLRPKGSEPHNGVVIGDTTGNPLKEISGPSLNILIKFMAMESLVFAPFFTAHGGLLFKL